MAGKGIIGALGQAAKAAAREADRRQRAAEREYNAAVRRAEQARKAEERARTQASKAAGREWKRLEKEAKAAHVAAKEAEVEELNSRLAAVYDSIDSLLAATIEIDDYVDLDSLRQTVEHPPFDRADLELPIPPPKQILDPPEPVFEPPPPPKGLFGRKKKHATAIAEAEAAHAQAHTAWEIDRASAAEQRRAAAEEHAQAERDRLATLVAERKRYEEECAAREEKVRAHNKGIDTLIANLGYGVVEAVEQYVTIVLSNSVYPEHFKVYHDFTFDPATAELSLSVLVPPPHDLPNIKAYKYTKAKDEITTVALSQKACKDRYLSAIQQVALRSFHEVFEADRRGLIKAISLEVGTKTIIPATGKPGHISFLGAATNRQTFLEFDLSAVVPAATLELLGAVVSKNPYGLVGIETTGVRQA